MEAFRTSDPLATLFELAEEFRSRIKRVLGVLIYAAMASWISLLLATPVAISLILQGQWIYLAALLAIIPISIVVAIWSFSEEMFVIEFRRRLEMVARANRWVRNPQVPPGADAISRFTALLKYDDRYVEPHQVRIERPFRHRTKAGKDIEFGCRVVSKGSPWVWGLDSHQVLIQVVEAPVAVQALERIRENAQELLGEKEWALTRIVALAETPEVSEEVRVFAQTSRVWYRARGTMGYRRYMGDRQNPFRQVPIELILERPEGTYEQLPLFYVS